MYHGSVFCGSEIYDDPMLSYCRTISCTLLCGTCVSCPAFSEPNFRLDHLRQTLRFPGAEVISSSNSGNEFYCSATDMTNISRHCEYIVMQLCTCFWADDMKLWSANSQKWEILIACVICVPDVLGMLLLGSFHSISFSI